MRGLLPILFFSLSVHAVFGQLDGFLASQNAAQDGNDINLSWSIARGNTCLGTEVERSINGGPFERVYFIGGICGSPDQEETYRWRDEDLTEGGVYEYRLFFGNLGFVSLFVTFTPVWESGMVVYQLSGGMGHAIRVEAFNAAYSIEVYDEVGHLVYDSGLVTQRELFLQSESWENGVYIAIVRSGGEVQRAKFAIYR